MSLVFCVLVAQMATLVLLLLPLPHALRVKILDITTALRLNVNVKGGVVFSIVLMMLQFWDCVNKVKRYSHTENPYFTQFNNQPQMSTGFLYDQLASKFYAQRNLYITGAVLYLALSINTVVGILRKLVSKETEYRRVKKLAASGTTDNAEATRLRELIKQREMDIATMKKQLGGVQTAYDALTESEVRNKND